MAASLPGSLESAGCWEDMSSYSTMEVKLQSANIGNEVSIRKCTWLWNCGLDTTHRQSDTQPTRTTIGLASGLGNIVWQSFISVTIELKNILTVIRAQIGDPIAATSPSLLLAIIIWSRMDIQVFWKCKIVAVFVFFSLSVFGRKATKTRCSCDNGGPGGRCICPVVVSWLQRYSHYSATEQVTKLNNCSFYSQHRPSVSENYRHTVIQ